MNAFGRNKASAAGSVERVRSVRSRNGGIVGEVFRATREVLGATLRDSLKELLEDLLHRGLNVMLLYGIAAALLGFGLILFLMGGFHALRMIPLPDAAAYAILGALALAGGILALRKTGTRGGS